MNYFLIYCKCQIITSIIVGSPRANVDGGGGKVDSFSV